MQEVRYSNGTVAGYRCEGCKTILPTLAAADACLRSHVKLTEVIEEKGPKVLTED
jgi:hypothetical protein